MLSGGIVKIVIGETEVLFRELLSDRLSEAGFRVGGGTENGKTLLTMTRRERPNLVMMNPLLKGMTGTALARQIRQELPRTRMLAMCRTGGPYLMDRVTKAGFHGCVQTADCTEANLMVALQVILEGGEYLCSESRKDMQRLDSDEAARMHHLSQREKQVLGLVGSGAGNEEIARRLDLSPATVQTHRRNLFRKLDLHDTPSLMRYAMDYGFWQPDFEELGIGPEQL